MIEIEHLSDPIKTTFILHSAKGVEDGRDVIYFSVTGAPPTFIVYDVNERKVIRSFKHESDANLSANWTMVKNPKDGCIYVGDVGKPAHILKYNPEDKSFSDAAELKTAHGIYHLSCDEEGNVYCGSAMGGRILKLSPNGAVTDFGQIIDGEKYVISSVYYKGAVFGGTRAEHPYFFRFDLKTKEVQIIETPSFVRGKYNVVYYMTLVDKYIFIVLKMNDGVYRIICYNADKLRWENINEKSFGGQHMSEPLNGKTYFISDDGYLKCINLNNMKTENTGIFYYSVPEGDSSLDYANGIMGGGFYKLKDDKYPGYTYITPNYDKNALAYINLEKKTVDFVSGSEILSDNIQIKALSSSPGENIVMGGYMGTKGVLYNIKTNSYSDFYCHQTEGITTVGDKNYFGVYTRAAIWEYDNKKEHIHGINPRQIFYTGYHQDRPFALCEAEGMLAAGTVPDYYELGGALVIYSPETGEKSVYNNLIENRSITGLCCYNGIIYGSTGVWGGLSSTPKENEAVIFTFSVKERKLISVKPLRFPFAHDKLLHIGNLNVNSSGELWGVTSGIIFKLNKDTLEVEEYADAYGINQDISTTVWKPFSIEFEKDVIYANPADMLVSFNIKTKELIKYDFPCFMLCKGEDNNIYFANGSSFYRLKTDDK